MTVARPPYVNLYPSDWKSGCSCLPMSAEWTFLQICLYNWDKGEACTPTQLRMILARNPEWEADVDLLVEIGKLVRTDGGGLFSKRAFVEAERSQTAYLRKVEGGKKGAENRWKNNNNDSTPIGDPSLFDSTPNGNQNQNQSHESENPEGFIYVGPEEIVAAWNEMAKPAKLPCISRITDTRRAHIERRLAEHGSQTILEAIAKIPQSEFLMGSTGWKANLDSMVRPDNMAKLIEGAYHGRSSGKQSGWLG